MSLVSILVRLALTGALAAIAVVLGSEWNGAYTQYGSEDVQDFGVAVGLAFLTGAAVSVWAYNSKLFGLAIRLAISVPFMAGMVLMMVWVGPPYTHFRFVAFTGAIILVLGSLFIALWAYWPEKRR